MKPSALLVVPPVYDFAFYDLFVRPLGLLRIGLWLENGGYDVTLVNALDPLDCDTLALIHTDPGKQPPSRTGRGTGKMFRKRIPLPPPLAGIPRAWSRYGIPEEVLRLKIGAARPDIILVSTMMTYWYPGVSEVVRLCRELHPGVPVVAGGVYATLMPDHCLNTCEPDTVISGEALPALGEILAGRGLPVPEGPVPAEYLIRREGCGDGAALRLNEGCPLSCRYCASKLLSPRFKGGDPERTARFLFRLHDTTGIRHFAFYDDALLVSKHRILFPFLRSVISENRGLTFSTPNALHIRHLDEETVDLMLAAGFREFRMGYESSDETFHHRMDDKFSGEDFRRVMNVMRARGLTGDSAAVYILAGLPGQSREEVADSLKAAGDAGAFTRLALYSPVPGTALWPESVRLSRYPLETEPLFHNNSVSPLEWSGLTREDLNALKGLTGHIKQGR